MIIKDHHAVQRRHLLHRYRWLGGLLLVIVLLAYWWWPEAPAAGSTLIRCDAEEVHRRQFITDGHRFGGGETQSDDLAHSGRYASRLLPGKDMQFGFSYRIDDVQSGAVYRASVWRFTSAPDDGALAVIGRGKQEFYESQNQPLEQEDNGWAKLEIVFQIPPGQSFDHIEVHVFSSGQDTVYFDDLEIERLIYWSGEGFLPARLELTIKPEAMDKLRAKRTEALAAGILKTKDDDWVEAALTDGDARTLPVEVRLKGDWLDHLQGDKWSFRVEVKKGQAWRRMTSFSLHTPAARYFLHEWLLHQFWEREDVLTTRYDFVELSLNGKPLGIYAYEEHFEKQLAESRQRREGPILKFNEDGFWAGMERQLQHHGFIRPGSGHSSMEAESARIEPFQENKTAGSEVLAAQFAEAQSLAEQYRRGLRAPSEVFDLERLARYFAVCDLLNGYHGVVWHNQRLYYNPLTSRLEPIGFDGFGGPPAEQYTILGQGALDPENLLSQSIFATLFLDPEFAAAYIRALYELSDPVYFGQFLDEMEEGWTLRLEFLQREFPAYQPELADFRTQAAFVRSLILPYPDHSLRTYTREYVGAMKQLSIANTHTLPVVVTGYGLSADGPVTVLDSTLLLPGHIPRRYLTRLLRDSLGRITDFNQIRFLEEEALARQSTRAYRSLLVNRQATHLFFQVLGIDSLFATPVSNWPPPQAEIPAQQLPNQLRDRPGLYRTDGEVVRFLTGELVSDEDIIIPAGHQVLFQAGTSLDLRAGARFLSRSPVQMDGEEEAPIRIFSSDASGQGFTVMEANGLSTLDHVIFENMTTFTAGGWALTGMVTFYESRVRLYRCAFLRAHCEDALNTVRTEIEVDQCRFGHTFSDAFDSDFCKGEIRNSRFYNTGNDGLDFSGSIINVYDCHFADNGDKGVSVGEESDVTLFNCSVSGAPIAVASKDLSVLYARNLSLKDCDQGFAAFQKKPEFGPARIIVESHTAENVRRLYSIGPGSTLQLGGQMIQ